MMTNIIGVKELRENFETFEKLVRTGQSFIVMKRSKPIFQINPVDDQGWETVIDFTTIRKNGILADELLKTLRKMH